MKNEVYISPVSIDLGAMNTGVLLAQYSEEELLAAEHCEAHVIFMPKDGDKMTYSQAARTQNRHLSRTRKRRKYAKRLLKLAFEQLLIQYKIILERDELDKAIEAISGLMNRRGFNRLIADEKCEHLDNYSIRPIQQLFDGLSFKVSDETLIGDVIIKAYENIIDLRVLNENFSKVNSKELNQILSRMDNIDKTEKKELLEIFIFLKGQLSAKVNDLDFGHRHRRDYLARITEEIADDSRLLKVVQKTGVDKLKNLIGNISNLQLRACRWYFNDKQMLSEEQWHPDKLKKVLIRWLEFWKPDSEEFEGARKLAIQKIGDANNVLDVLCELDALTTIPPYEDQDNRKPPKDMTLWLSPQKLLFRFNHKPAIWVNNFLFAKNEVNKRLDELLNDEEDSILNLFDRKSMLVPQNERVDRELRKNAYILQRLLDRTQLLDVYKLRKLCNHPNPSSCHEEWTLLGRDLGEQHRDEFIEFARAYYEEVEFAKQGLWDENDESNLLERADINPPKKKKILHLLVGNILGIPNFKRESYEDFLILWKTKVTGNTTLSRICEKIESLRKLHGNAFNEKYHQVIYKVDKLGFASKSLSKEENDFYKIIESVGIANQKIASFFKHDALHAQKYNNAYSLSQLYNLIQTDRAGFTKTSLAAHLENNWRMTEIELLEGGRTAFCSRLPADSSRPFDGVLRRILDRQAYEIASLKAQQIKKNEVTNAKLLLPILIEENRFSFNQSLADIKKSGSSKINDLGARNETQMQKWQSKIERIKQASKGICPYTGIALNNITDEIDHIIPQSQSKSQRGTVFNSEANLIYCSRDGNQQKQDKRYDLSKLSNIYLKAIFKTDNLVDIKECIERTVFALNDDFIYEILNKEQQQSVRHALFLESNNPAFQKVFRRLTTHMTARVNGTQAWFVRQIIINLKKELNGWDSKNNILVEYSTAKISPEITHQVRQKLADYDNKFIKQPIQAVTSHAIDALCVLAVAASQPKLENTLKQGAMLSEDMSLLSAIMPTNISIKRIERKARYERSCPFNTKMFKDGIYAEHFLPLWIDEKGLRIGFNPNNEVIYFKDPKESIHYFLPFLKHSIDIDSALVSEKPIRLAIDKNKAFEHFRFVAKQPSNDTAIEQADALDMLHYLTEKKEIWNFIIDQQTGYKTKEKILDKEKTQVKLNATTKMKKLLSTKNLSIELPSARQWRNLLEIPEIKAKLGSKDKNEPENYKDIIHSFFKVPKSKRPHAKARSKYSLPIKTSVSGGYRILRQPDNFNPVWQLYAGEGSFSSGVKVLDDGKIDWNSPHLLPVIEDSQTIVPLHGRFDPNDKFVAFNHWLQIEHDLGCAVKVSMCPGTLDRCYIRVELPFTLFCTWISKSGNCPNNPFELGAEFSLKGDFNIGNESVVAGKILGKPRSKLFFEAIGEQIKFYYIVNQTNSEMKAAYQHAFNEQA